MQNVSHNQKGKTMEKENNIENKKLIVTVTGGTGYIASWIVQDLLYLGHEVRITVRDKSKVANYQHLMDIAKDTPGTLSVFEADLLKKGSFDAAVKDAIIVMHTASPFVLDDKDDPIKNLVKPAVEGTINLLSAVNKSESVKRVVLTSSVAAIYGDNIDLADQGIKILNESYWNTTSSISHNAYSFSKTEAEKAGWEMAKAQERWDLVTIHPGFVLGPSLTKRIDSTSIQTLLRILHGDLAIGSPELNFVFSDVRDIAKGHILAAFTENAVGRYIIAKENGNLLNIGSIIEKNFKGLYKVPKHIVPKWLIWMIAPMVGFSRKYVTQNIGYPISCDPSKSIKELGMTYHSLEETIVDHVKQIQRDGLI